MQVSCWARIYYSKGLRVSQPKANLFWNISFYLASDVKKTLTPCISDPRSMYLFIFFIREIGKREGGLAGSIYILAFLSLSFPERRRCRNILATFSSFLFPLLLCNIYAGIGEREGGGEIFGGTVLVFSKMHQSIDKSKVA